MSASPVRLVSFELSDAQVLLEQLRLAAQSDGASPRSFALLLRKASKTQAWSAEFPSFRAYLHASEADGGLGMDDQAFLHIANLGGIEDLARRLLFDEIEKAAERPGRPTAVNSSGTRINQRPNVPAVVARLKRDDPGLAEKVIAGEVSANAAAMEKGWRKPRILVTSPEAVARALLKHMSADDIAKLIAALLGKDGGLCHGSASTISTRSTAR